MLGGGHALPEFLEVMKRLLFGEVVAMASADDIDEGTVKLLTNCGVRQLLIRRRLLLDCRI